MEPVKTYFNYYLKISELKEITTSELEMPELFIASSMTPY